MWLRMGPLEQLRRQLSRSIDELADAELLSLADDLHAALRLRRAQRLAPPCPQPPSPQPPHHVDEELRSWLVDAGDLPPPIVLTA